MIVKGRKSASLSYALLSETAIMLADFIAQGRVVEPINAVQMINTLPNETLELLAIFMRRHAREVFVAGDVSTVGAFVYAVANARAHLADPSSPHGDRGAQPRLLTDVERLGLYPGA